MNLVEMHDRVSISTTTALIYFFFNYFIALAGLIVFRNLGKLISFGLVIYSQS